MVNQVAAQHQRHLIPARWLIVFEQITDYELASMAVDEELGPELQAYCGWELEYREAYGIAVYYDDALAGPVEVACRIDDRAPLFTYEHVGEGIKRRKT